MREHHAAVGNRQHEACIVESHDVQIACHVQVGAHQHLGTTAKDSGEDEGNAQANHAHSLAKNAFCPSHLQRIEPVGMADGEQHGRQSHQHNDRHNGFLPEEIIERNSNQQGKEYIPYLNNGQGAKLTGTLQDGRLATRDGHQPYGRCQ